MNLENRRPADGTTTPKRRNDRNKDTATASRANYAYLQEDPPKLSRADLPNVGRANHARTRTKRRKGKKPAGVQSTTQGKTSAKTGKIERHKTAGRTTAPQTAHRRSPTASERATPATAERIHREKTHGTPERIPRTPADSPASAHRDGDSLTADRRTDTTPPAGIPTRPRIL